MRFKVLGLFMVFRQLEERHLRFDIVLERLYILLIHCTTICASVLSFFEQCSVSRPEQVTFRVCIISIIFLSWQSSCLLVILEHFLNLLVKSLTTELLLFLFVGLLPLEILHLLYFLDVLQSPLLCPPSLLFFRLSLFRVERCSLSRRAFAALRLLLRRIAAQLSAQCLAQPLLQLILIGTWVVTIQIPC